jgi:hypothetical protein
MLHWYAVHIGVVQPLAVLRVGLPGVLRYSRVLCERRNLQQRE